MAYQYRIYNVTTGQYVSTVFSSSSNVITLPNNFNSGTYLGYIYHTSWEAAINQYYSGSVDGSSTTVTVPSSYPYLVFFVSTGTATTYEAYAYLPYSSDGSADLPKINSWTTVPSSISAPTYDGYTCKGYVIGSDLYNCVAQYMDDGITVALTVCSGSALSATYPCVMFVYVQMAPTTYTSWQTPTQIASISSDTVGLASTASIGCYQAGYIKYITPSYAGKLVCKTTSGLTSPDFYSYLADELLSAGSDPNNRSDAVAGDGLLIYDDDGGEEGYDTQISYESDGDETYYWYVNAEFQSSGSYTVPWQLNYYKRYTISYNANGGSMTSTTTKFYDDTYHATITSKKPTRSGYKFLGWSTSSTATTAGYQSGGTYIFDSSNQYLYAVWQKANYTLTYDANGGENAPSSVTFSSDSSITINTTSYPTRTGYIFKGWATSNSTNIPIYKKDVSYTATFSNSIILYAIWWPEWVWDNHSITEANNINQYVNTYCGITNNTDITPGTIYLWQWIKNIAEVLGGYEEIKNQKIVSNSIIEILKTYYEQF